MLNANLRVLCVFFLAAVIARAAVPRVTSVEPTFGKNGEELVVHGQNLDAVTVTNLFLTASGEDHEVEIEEQTYGSNARDETEVLSVEDAAPPQFEHGTPADDFLNHTGCCDQVIENYLPVCLRLGVY